MPAKVRVFLWHVSRFQTPTYWSVRVGSNGTGGTISNLTRYVVNETTADLSAIGLCIAWMHRFGTIDPVPSSPTSILEEADVLTLGSGHLSTMLPKGSTNPGIFTFLGAILEFDVTGATELTMRTAVSLDGQSWGSSSDDPTPSSNNWANPGVPNPTYPTHVRGYWRRSEINLDFAYSFNCNPVQPPPHYVEFDFGESGGAEATYFSLANSLAVASTPNGNPAAYGANLNFKGTYFNPNSNDAGAFYIGIRARNNGGKYFGVSIVDAAGTSSDAANMLPIPQSHPNDNLKGYSIIEFYPHLVHLGFVYVPPQSGPLDYTIRIANAGACATPANIILSTDGVWPEPTEGGA